MSITSQFKKERERPAGYGTLVTLHMSTKDTQADSDSPEPWQKPLWTFRNTGDGGVWSCLEAASHSLPYLTCHGGLSGSSFSLPPILRGVWGSLLHSPWKRVQGTRHLSCGLALAPQQWAAHDSCGIQTALPVSVASFLVWRTKTAGSWRCLWSNEPSESKRGCVNLYQQKQSDFGPWPCFLCTWHGKEQRRGK